MAHNPRFSIQTNLEICEAERKDLEGEVLHLKVLMKSKNQEIGELKSKLKSSESEIMELKDFLMTHISALTARLVQNHESENANKLIYRREKKANPEHEPETLPNHLDTTITSSEDIIDQAVLITAAPISPEAPSSPQPDEELAVAEANLSHHNNESPLSAHKPAEHLTMVQGDDSTTAPANTIPPVIDTKKNKAKKFQRKVTNLKKPQEIDHLKSALLTSSCSVNLRKLNMPFPECGKLDEHSLEETHGNSVKKEDGDHEKGADEVRVFIASKVQFKIRSTSGNGIINGVVLHNILHIRPSTKVGKLLAIFSIKLSVPLEKLLLRCNGRELEHGEEVSGLAHQTVWLTVIEVKEEDMGLMHF